MCTIIKTNTNKRNPLQQGAALWRNCKSLRTLKQIHCLMVTNGFNFNRVALRELVFVSAVTVPSAINYAHELFGQISKPDLFMWNTMLRGSAQSPKPSLTIPLFAKLEKNFIKPDSYTFPFVLKACTRLCWVNTGSLIHGKIVKHGFESNKFSRNTLIYFHANCGDIKVARNLFDDMARRDVVAWSAMTAGYARRGLLDQARNLFDEMPEKDLVSWNVMITGHVKQGELERAMELFNIMPRRDVVTWNTMISGYVLHEKYPQAFAMYEEMSDAGYYADEITMLSLVSACGDSGALDEGEKLYHLILKTAQGGVSTVMGNALIAMYAKCGCIAKSLQVFLSMKEKDLTSWNSVISGLAFNSHSEKCIDLFEQMRRSKFAPNDITFTGVLLACSHSGKVNAGRGYFNLMRDHFNIEPNVRHCGCMVDMLGRAGLLEEAFDFIDKMEIEPNSVIWRTLLGACQVHGNVELGKRANEELLKLQQDASGDYVLLSNIFAQRGEWAGAEKVRKLMDDSGVWKEPGQSVIESESLVFPPASLNSKSEKHLRDRCLLS